MLKKGETMDKEILDVLEELTDICRDMADELYEKSNCDDVRFHMLSNSF